MNKIFRNVVVIVSAIIGFVALSLAILHILGIDTGIDCPVCNGAKKNIKKDSTPVPQTRIRRHYTEIKLPKDEA